MNIYVYSVNCSQYNEMNNKIIIKELTTIYDELQIYSFDDFLNNNKILDMKIEHVIVSGGDGVFHRVVNHLKNKLEHIIFGYIPTGTANDFAHNYQIDCKNIQESIAIIKSNNVIEVPLIRINDNLALYGISVGKMSNVSIKTSKNAKRLFHKLIYKIKGIKYMFFKKEDVYFKDINEEKIYHLKALLIIRTKYLGGVRISKDFTEKLAIVPIKNIFSLIKIFIFGRFMNLKKLNTNEIEIISDSVWCVDGELIDIKKAKINYNQNKMRLLSKNT